MTRTFKFGFLLLLLTASALSFQDPDSLVRVAWYLQDQRRDPVGQLADVFLHRAPTVRRAAFRAAAHIRDSASIAPILKGLQDSDAGVRHMAAFAAGQLGAPSLTPRLLLASLREKDLRVRSSMLDAIGRTGTLADLDSLGSLFPVKSRRDRPGVLMAMTRFALRGIRSPRALWYAIECLADRNPEVRWRSLYLLWRSAPHPLLATEFSAKNELFARLATDPSADVRLNLATLLGRIESEEARILLMDLFTAEGRRNDPDWRVRVQLVRAAGVHVRGDGSIAALLLRGLNDANDHVVIAACMALPGDAAPLRSMDLRDSVRSALWGLVRSGRSRPPFVAGEAAVALLRFHPEEADDVLAFSQGPDMGVRIRSKILEGVSLAPTPAGWTTMRSAWDDPTIAVAMAAWDHSRRFFRQGALETIAPNTEDQRSLSNAVFEGMVRALQRNDMGLSTVVCTLLSDSSTVALLDSAGYRPSVVDSLASSLARMKVPDDVEAMQAAVQALGYLGGPHAIAALEGALGSPDRTVVEEVLKALMKATGVDRRSSIRPAGSPAHVDYDWQLLRSLGAKPAADIVTDRGTVTLDLLPEEAPFTVLSFVRLARAGFFEGLTFHRVVPNFVVQGGDPRGDGWGGPGYALRTESSPMSYERGSVGMASAGNDTEGSQFFITHVPTPHLDTRYTIFARVVHGMDVVDRLQVGDSIKEIRIRTQRGARSR